MDYYLDLQFKCIVNIKFVMIFYHYLLIYHDFFQFFFQNSLEIGPFLICVCTFCPSDVGYIWTLSDALINNKFYK